MGIKELNLSGRLFSAGRFSSEDYWQKRYKRGGNSGAGSFGRLAAFKANTLNGFVEANDVLSVIEFGCGDGSQLELAKYPRYVGVDVSCAALNICTAKFGRDQTKEFLATRDYNGERADLSLSLDVIFHLVEDHVFERYMFTLFEAATRFVVIYSSNMDDHGIQSESHIRRRKFTDWIDTHRMDWPLIGHIRNAFPFDGESMQTSFSDFYFYKNPETQQD